MSLIQRNFEISSDQPLFQGHFPGRPILPGVMLLHFIIETLTLELSCQCRLKNIIRHKFIKSVVPGNIIRVECEVTKPELVGVASLDCRIFDQDNALVASGQYNVEFLAL